MSRHAIVTWSFAMVVARLGRGGAAVFAHALAGGAVQPLSMLIPEGGVVDGGLIAAANPDRWGTPSRRRPRDPRHRAGSPTDGQQAKSCRVFRRSSRSPRLTSCERAHPSAAVPTRLLQRGERVLSTAGNIGCSCRCSGGSSGAELSGPGPSTPRPGPTLRGSCSSARRGGVPVRASPPAASPRSRPSRHPLSSPIP